MSELIVFTESQVLDLRKFIDQRRNNPFVVRRYDRNVQREGPYPDRSLFWKGLVSCLLTSQQKASPGMPVWRFMKREPFPLTYIQVKSHTDLNNFVKKCLTNSKGIRFTNNIAKYADYNLNILESGSWSYVESLIRELWDNDHQSVERGCAEKVRKQFLGLGPKQSRNLLQLLGLTRYEIPIDSRMLGWLKSFGFDALPDAKLLSNPRLYNQILDGIQHLCQAAEVYPCIFDAAVFSSMDKVGWNEQDIIF